MDPTERIKIAQAASARDALKIARSSTGMKWFWEQQCSCGDLFKERVMFMALMQKFSVNEPRLRMLLLSTGTCQLVSYFSSLIYFLLSCDVMTRRSLL